MENQKKKRSTTPGGGQLHAACGNAGAYAAALDLLSSLLIPPPLLSVGRSVIFRPSVLGSARFEEMITDSRNKHTHLSYSNPSYRHQRPPHPPSFSALRQTSLLQISSSFWSYNDDIEICRRRLQSSSGCPVVRYIAIKSLRWPTYRRRMYEMRTMTKTSNATLKEMIKICRRVSPEKQTESIKISLTLHCKLIGSK